MPITLLTDFGTADYFVGAMKGVIVGMAPSVPVVDLTHEIPPHEVAAGAFTLLAAYDAFPAGTVHLAVVDPGVGSARRAVALVGRHTFVGPDNGILTYVLETEPDARAYAITNHRLFRHPVSATFHGRDVFAPVAAALAMGLPAEELGPATAIADLVRLPSSRVEVLPDGSLRARVLHVDRFGNCVTTLTRHELPDGCLPDGARLTVGGHEVRSLRRYYADTSDGDPLFAIWGSAGFLEISVNAGSAAARLGVRTGSEVRLIRQ